MDDMQALATRILIAGLLAACASLSFASADDAVLVWGKPVDRSLNLFFAERKNSQWSRPEQITDSALPDVQPSVIADKSGNVWVAWVQLHGANGQLRYRFQQDGQWLPPADLPTGLITNLAPSIVLDGSGLPWLVWAGYDGKDDEIFFARWNGSGWSKPARVNEDNEVPDIVPEIGLDADGAPVVGWVGFNGDIYVHRYRVWDGSGWKETTGDAAGELSMKDFKPVELPDYVKETSQASIYVLGSRRSVSLRDRVIP